MSLSNEIDISLVPEIFPYNLTRIENQIQFASEDRHLLVAKFKSIVVSLPYQKTKYNKKLKTSHQGGKTQIYYG